MKINLEINNLSKSPIEEDFFSEVAEETLEEIKFDFLKGKDLSLSLALVPKKEIKKINKEYRKINTSTDVLSFPEFETQKKLKAQKENELFLGEIILCYDDIKKYAKENNLELKKELAKVFSHGILHLLGFQHGTKMFSIQEKIAKNFSN